MCSMNTLNLLINFTPFKQAYEKWTDEEKFKYDKLEPVVRTNTIPALSNLRT
jgi:hypothetical protein